MIRILISFYLFSIASNHLSAQLSSLNELDLSSAIAFNTQQFTFNNPKEKSLSDVNLTQLKDDQTGEIIVKGQLMMYPNPVDSYFDLIGSFVPVQIFIYDQRGILHYRSESISEKINLANLRNGPYILKARNTAGEEVSMIFYKN